jgi:hypothetical protein
MHVSNLIRRPNGGVNNLRQMKKVAACLDQVEAYYVVAAVALVVLN